MLKIKSEALEKQFKEKCNKILRNILIVAMIVIAMVVIVIRLIGNQDLGFFNNKTTNITNTTTWWVTVYWTIFDYINNKTACKIVGYKNAFTLQDIYNNTYNLQHIMWLCLKLKETKNQKEREKLIDNIVKGFQFIIKNSYLIRFWQSYDVKKNNKLTTNQQMNYYQWNNSEYDLHLLKLYIDGKEYNIYPKAPNKKQTKKQKK